MTDIDSGLQRIFDLQNAVKDKLACSTVSERRAKLDSLLRVILKSSDKIEKAIYLDFKKDPTETRITEIFNVVSEIRYAKRNLSKWMKSQKVSAPITFLGSSNKTVRVPKGNALIISPWNFPFLLAVSPLVSAVAAGNTVILKPSETSYNTAVLLKSFFANIFPEDEVAVITGDHSITQELFKLPFDHILFTGSTNIGKMVYEAAAKNLTTVTLELGGKSPVVVDQSANLKIAAERIVWGKLLNGGQACVAADYVLIDEKLTSSFKELILTSIKKLYGDTNTIQSNNELSRIINKKHFDRLRHAIEDAVQKGGELLLGGQSNEADLFISPTFILNPPMSSIIMQEEVFGPILPLITYSHKEEIFQVIEKNPNPLNIFLFSSDKIFIDEVAKKISCGNIVINDIAVHFANPSLSFGGVKTSGIGRTHGYAGFKEFSVEKSIMKQPGLSTVKLFYPPYTKFVKKAVDFAIKYL
ncbi:MAG: aldehyde dehydrogenase family protein [bacterium]